MIQLACNNPRLPNTWWRGIWTPNPTQKDLTTQQVWLEDQGNIYIYLFIYIQYIYILFQMAWNQPPRMITEPRLKRRRRTSFQIGRLCLQCKRCPQSFERLQGNNVNLKYWKFNTSPLKVGHPKKIAKEGFPTIIFQGGYVKLWGCIMCFFWVQHVHLTHVRRRAVFFYNWWTCNQQIHQNTHVLEDIRRE